MDLAFVLVVVGLAGLFLLKRVRQSLSPRSGGSGGGCGCGSVKPGCSAPAAKRPIPR